MFYPQNGDRVVTTDSVTSLHPMYKTLNNNNNNNNNNKHFV